MKMSRATEARARLVESLRDQTAEDIVEMMVIKAVEDADCGCCPGNWTITVQLDAGPWSMHDTKGAK